MADNDNHDTLEKLKRNAKWRVAAQNGEPAVEIEMEEPLPDDDYTKSERWNYLPVTEMMKPSDVMRELCISKTTLYQHIKEGKLPPPIHYGGSRSAYFRTAQIRAVTEGRSWNDES